MAFRAMRAEEARSFYEEAAGILRKMGYEVDITNGLELTFDSKFNLIEIDD